MRSSRIADGWLVFCCLIAVGVGSRVAKELLDLSLPNLHAVTAAALFAGCYFSSRRVAMLVPLVAMSLSDLVIGGHQPLVMASVYGCLAAPVLLRGWLRLESGRWMGAGAAALVSSTLFFAATNLAVWWCSYAHTWSGLGRCYAAAVPFFGYTLAGDLLATYALFAGYALLTGSAAATDPTPTARAARRELAAA